jgi:hypothetical protein
LADGDGEANESVDSAVCERVGGWRVGVVCFRAGWRPRPCRPGGPGPCAEQSLVPGQSMEPELGQNLRLGLESLPRLARSGRPNRSDGLPPLGSSAAVGAAAATPTAVGARGSADVESDCQWLGILEQRNMDSDLTKPTATPRRHRACQPSGMRCEERLVRQAGGQLIDVERLVEAGVQLLGIDQHADLGGLASEQPTETRV